MPWVASALRIALIGYILCVNWVSNSHDKASRICCSILYVIWRTTMEGEVGTTLSIYKLVWGCASRVDCCAFHVWLETTLADKMNLDTTWLTTTFQQHTWQSAVVSSGNITWAYDIVLCSDGLLGDISLLNSIRERWKPGDKRQRCDANVGDLLVFQIYKHVVSRWM